MKEWDKLCNNLFYDKKTGLMIEYGGMDISDKYIAEKSAKLDDALVFMDELEKGCIANPDEKRMVGHYWLRNTEIAPKKEIADEINGAKSAVKKFADAVIKGKILSEKNTKFKYVLVSGMGGSSLGPAFIYDALHEKGVGTELYFLDNTDPAGMDRIFGLVEECLDETLLIVISKSGGTIETRNSMEEARAFYEGHGLDFGKHAVCITGKGSKLEAQAEREGWLAVFPMWDWVGGRTSVMSAVGLLPLSLAGIDVDGLLLGASDCDRLGRNKSFRDNPAAIMALAWYFASGGEGGESMVVLPYRDSLGLFAKYLQQL
ncbi:MAG: glucose-6-phosphate isomerase, partial [Firmicutes bacterium]|nr:glucose-6-phosphate isomerase [Bacillota bacterium]